ncbi:MAG: hypothetical protein Q3Y08_10545 [Butyricicoccus sp.]|nr:hypothetical protein [Butyricicoccus sp.]
MSDKGTVSPDEQNVQSISYGVQPAFDLDPTDILFTSSATVGKSTETGLTAVGEYTGSEWKLTFLDSNRNFSISDAKIQESMVNFSYSDAQTGTNEYISVLLKAMVQLPITDAFCSWMVRPMAKAERQALRSLRV